MKTSLPAGQDPVDLSSVTAPALSGPDLLLWSVLPDLSLNIAQTAALCGVSVRQLSYWTQQGYITATGRGARRLFGPEALRRVLAIRQSMQNGLSLRQSLRALEGHGEASDPILAAPGRAQPDPTTTPGVAGAVAGDLLHLFDHNRSTRDSAPGLAIKLGRAVDDVRAVVERLTAHGVLNKTSPGGEAIYARVEGNAP